MGEPRRKEWRWKRKRTRTQPKDLMEELSPAANRRRTPNGRGLVFIPPPVVEKYEADGERTADGRLWARPTMMKLKPGDAVLVLHSVPHCASLNDLGADPRIMIYFRLTPQARPQD